MASSTSSTSSSLRSSSSSCSSSASCLSSCTTNGESNSNCCRHARSISLPTKPIPVLHKLEQELTKLKAWEESSTSAADTVTIGLSGIVSLYKCIDQAISLPATQQALFFHHKGTCIEDLLDASSCLLDITSSAAQLVMQLKEAGGDLRSALRADEKCYIGAKCSIASYICTRKRTVKDVKGILLSLKRIDEKFGQQLPIHDQGRLSVFIKALRCVSIINISILESLLFFLATPVACKPKSGRWSIASRFLEGRSTSCGRPEQGTKKRDEMRDADTALRSLCQDDGKKVEEMKGELAVKRLQNLEMGMERIAKGLEGMLKQLTNTRSSLLSIFTF